MWGETLTSNALPKCWHFTFSLNNIYAYTILPDTRKVQLDVGRFNVTINQVRPIANVHAISHNCIMSKGGVRDAWDDDWESLADVRRPSAGGMRLCG